MMEQTPTSSERTPLVANNNGTEHGLAVDQHPVGDSSIHEPPKGTCKSTPLFSLVTTLWVAVVCVAIGTIGGSFVTHRRLSSSSSGDQEQADPPISSSYPPQYSQFQGLGYQIYTGGAPVYLTDGSRNPECMGRTSLGHLDDEEHDDGRDNLYCYLGDSNDTVDVYRRLEILTHAVERAYQLADRNPNVLKIFICPEFFWRGKDGAYFFNEEDNIPETTTCGEVCQILMGLEQLIAQSRFEDWMFLFGTVITAELLPKEDTWDYIFLNFAPLYRGYNPQKTSHIGQRFLVPKRYVSNIDFLTPLRHYNKTLARQIIDDESTQPIAENDSTVFNPFLDRGKYNNQVWDNYKVELDRLEYIMIEYDWVIIDGIVFTVEVCLDHDMSTALNSYTADAVTGKHTRIPLINTSESSISHVPIPHEMADISLVSSAGMSINKGSIATTNLGYTFLQDGLNDQDPRMFFEAECFAGLSFEGSTEIVQRYAVITPNDVLFEHRIQPEYQLHKVYQEQHHHDWKRAMDGIFSAVKYEPHIAVYPPMEIPRGSPS